MDVIPHSPATRPQPAKSWRIKGEGPNWRYVTMCCPGGHLSSLQHLSHPELQQSGHKIADDGTVTPSVVCPAGDCDYHEWVRLEGWSAPMRAAQPTDEA